MKGKKPVIAYHFTGDKLRDGSPIPSIGKWLTYSGPVKMCQSGLHASRDPFDALTYAPGPLLHLVHVEDIIDEEKDKLVCRRRKIVRSGDATEMLRYFARMQALSVIHLWDAPDVVCDYLMTGDEGIRSAAGDAAGDAARSAARSAEYPAARSAEYAAARSAARSAEYAAARSAEYAAAHITKHARHIAQHFRRAPPAPRHTASPHTATAAQRKHFNGLVSEFFH